MGDSRIRELSRQALAGDARALEQLKVEWLRHRDEPAVSGTTIVLPPVPPGTPPTVTNLYRIRADGTHELIGRYDQAGRPLSILEGAPEGVWTRAVEDVYGHIVFEAEDGRRFHGRNADPNRDGREFTLRARAVREEPIVFAPRGRETSPLLFRNARPLSHVCASPFGDCEVCKAQPVTPEP